MTLPTLTASDGGFDDLEFALLVADLNPVQRRNRPSRAVETAEAIRASLGVRRHRSNEREA